MRFVINGRELVRAAPGAALARCVGRPAVHRGACAPPRARAAGHRDHVRVRRRRAAYRQAACERNSAVCASCGASPRQRGRGAGGRPCRRRDGPRSLATAGVAAVAWLSRDRARIASRSTSPTRRAACACARGRWAPTSALIGSVPGGPRALYLFAQEGERWILTLRASAGAPPPKRPGGPCRVRRLGRAAGRVEAIAKRPARRRSPRMASPPPAPPLRARGALAGRPAGVRGRDLLVQPIYGQGMCVAAPRRSRSATAWAGSHGLPAATCAPRRGSSTTPGSWQPAPTCRYRRRPGPRPLPMRLRTPTWPACKPPPPRTTRRVASWRSSAVVGLLEPPPRAPAPRHRRARAPRPAPAPAGAGHAGCAGTTCAVDGVRTPVRRPDRPAPVRPSCSCTATRAPAPTGSPCWRRSADAAVRSPGTRQASDARSPRRTSRRLSPRTPPSSAVPSTRSASSARTWSSHDFGGPWGLRWAASDAGPLPRRRHARHGRAARLPVARARARLARAAAPASCSWPPPRGSGFRALLRRGNPRGLPRPFVDRMYDDFDRATRRAVLDLYRSVDDVAAAGERARRGAAPARPSGARAVGAPRPVPPGRARRAPARGVPQRRRSACWTAAATGRSSTIP